MIYQMVFLWDDFGFAFLMATCLSNQMMSDDAVSVYKNGLFHQEDQLISQISYSRDNQDVDGESTDGSPDGFYSEQKV